MLRTRSWSTAVPVFLVIGLMLFSFIKEISAQTYYTATEIGRLDPTSAYNTQPNAVNSHGQVVGQTGLRNSNGSYTTAFLWQNGVLTDIGTMTGSQSSVSANDINDAGQIVGAGDVLGASGPHALWWHDGTYTDLHPMLMQTDLVSSLPTLENKYSFALKINNAGQILCMVDGSLPGPSRPQFFRKYFIYSNEIVTPITVPNENLVTDSCCQVQVLDLNSLGKAVGIALQNSGWGNTFVWDHGTTLFLDQLANWPSSYPTSINDSGQIVGSLWNGVSGSNFLYENSTMEDIGDVGVRAINNSGVIIGGSQFLSNYSGALRSWT
jgi:probable HAF family extracellular repeat protein